MLEFHMLIAVCSIICCKGYGSVPGKKIVGEKFSHVSSVCAGHGLPVVLCSRVVQSGVALLLPHKCSSWHWLFIGFLKTVNIGGKAHISESEQVPVKTVKLCARLLISERRLLR